ncbi:hypothetical protein ABIE09_003161 [Lysobacter enzymogenes]|jgi:hypothetical protein|uniref:hypothetical protein n=1 Tax=Lysobacter enzymogenes TaxID=69 RepID=UPI0009424C08|nr:hypothetical protein [Lysobacter enzymogenes]MBN7137839.1 hypothetical protein [Lysobacter enzymogenes]
MIGWLLMTVDSLESRRGDGSVGNLSVRGCAHRARTLRADIAIDVRRLRDRAIAQRGAARRR